MSDGAGDGTMVGSSPGSSIAGNAIKRSVSNTVTTQQITDYITTVLSKYRDNPELRLNIVMHPKPSVEARPINPTVTAGIIAAIKMNQWFVANTLCHLNVTENFHLTPNVMLNLLRRILNTHESGELGGTMMILQKHLFLHPPSYNPQVSLRQLYSKLLTNDCMEMLNGDTASKEGFFVQVLNELTKICGNRQEDSGSVSNDNEEEEVEEEECDVGQLPLFELVNAMEAGQVYKNLSGEDKLQRLELALDYAVSVLEQDFLAWHASQPVWNRLRSTLHSPKRRPLLVDLVWPRVFDWRICACNAFCRRVAQLLWVGKLQQPLLRLLALLAESMFISECDGKFHKFGAKCCALAREVSLGMCRSADGLARQACQLKPDWLALLVVHQAVGKVVQPGNVGMPSLDLVEACMVLVNRGPAAAANTNPAGEIDLELAEPAAKVNKRDQIGETRLHKACKKNNVAKVSALLRQPHVDVNAADNAGWTPLHEAVAAGATDCVRALLAYRSSSGTTVDLRVKSSQEGITPLMDAVSRGKAEICRLLLDNAGWCLLEDARVNGLKAEDLEKSAEVEAVLAASRMGKRSLMFNNLTCVDLPQLTTLLPVYFQLYLSTYKVHLVSRKASHRDPLLNKTKSSCFDYATMGRSLKILTAIRRAAVQGSEIDRILKGDL